MKRPQFIVLTYPRTGSSLLCGSLGAHPQITQASEIFHESDPHTVDREPAEWRETVFQRLYHKSPSEMTKPGVNGNMVLDDILLVPFAKELVEKYNGFKLQYHQLPPNSPVVDFLSHIEGLKLIYLERELVDTAVSFHTSTRTGVWQRFSLTQVVPEIRLTLETDAMVWFYHEFCMRAKTYRRKFAHCESVTIQYRDLADNWQNIMHGIQEFLGIEPLDLPQCLYRKNLKPLKDSMTNYEEFMKTLGDEDPESYCGVRHRLL